MLNVATRQGTTVNILKGWCVALALTFLPTAVYAENCTASRAYILTDPLGDLPQSPQSYQDLFRMCLTTLELSNVKDAFLLKNGAVAVIPRNDGIIATANTLAEFCERFPSGRLRFISRGEQQRNRELGEIVRLSATSATPCQNIKRDQF
jgi:hypothetical protein